MTAARYIIASPRCVVPGVFRKRKLDASQAKRWLAKGPYVSGLVRHAERRGLAAMTGTYPEPGDGSPVMLSVGDQAMVVDWTGGTAAGTGDGFVASHTALWLIDRLPEGEASK